jgi:hypothetical protein
MLNTIGSFTRCEQAGFDPGDGASYGISIASGDIPPSTASMNKVGLHPRPD